MNNISLFKVILFNGIITLGVDINSALMQYPSQGTYKNCDVCSITKCKPGHHCRAVGRAGYLTVPVCIPAADIGPVFMEPKCARGTGDTAVKSDGIMIKCITNTDCPREFVCSAGACCRDATKCQKIGNCPSTVSWCGENNKCTNDSECPGDAKCCGFSNCHGQRCIRPLFTGRR